MTRVLITGCRHWNPPFAAAVVARLRTRYGPGLVIVHGAARGVDEAFGTAARVFGVAEEPHPADWQAHGRGAGPRRNAAMVALGAAFALACHRDVRASKGTLDCVRRCLAAGIPVWLIDNAEGTPKRLTEV